MKFEDLIMRALGDDDFRQQLKDDPDAALQELGVPEEDRPGLVEAFNKLDWEAIDYIREAFGTHRQMMT